MLDLSLFEQVLDYANRANPYPLYERLRQTPVARQADGRYVVSTYREIVELLNDPRASSDQRRGSTAEAAVPDQQLDPAMLPGFVHYDPPEHDRVRRQATWPYGPPHTPGRVAGMEPEIVRIANRLIDTARGKTRVDLVEDFAYPLPVTVICELLGVPREDEPRFHVWTEAITAGTAGAADSQASPQERQQLRDESAQAVAELRKYMAGLAERDRQQPGPDLLSGLVTDHGPDGSMASGDVVDTGILLLFAGHETTVNLITNGMLTLLRHPEVLDRLRREPDLVIRLIEELLRYEPPVQMLANRWALADIATAGTTIPRGSTVILLLASGNRDPARFRDPERFDPDRADNQHVGFGSGIHHCFGAPLARLEAQIALTELARRLENPRLVQDPPPYRQSATLRGPRHLLVEIDGVCE
jgi:cytochrome P450